MYIVVLQNKQSKEYKIIFLGAWKLQPGHCECEPGGQRDVHLPGQHRPSHQQGEEAAAPVRRLI